MAFDFEKFYGVGTHLDNFSKDEEYQRSSITRYYYSVFHSVKEYYEKSFRQCLPIKDAHSLLINELEKSPFVEERLLGEKLRTLRNNRNHADYRRKNIGKNLTKDSKKKTDEIISNLDYLLKHPLRIMK